MRAQSRYPLSRSNPANILCGRADRATHSGHWEGSCQAAMKEQRNARLCKPRDSCFVGRTQGTLDQSWRSWAFGGGPSPLGATFALKRKLRRGSPMPNPFPTARNAPVGAAPRAAHARCSQPGIRPKEQALERAVNRRLVFQQRIDPCPKPHPSFAKRQISTKASTIPRTASVTEIPSTVTTRPLTTPWRARTGVIMCAPELRSLVGPLPPGDGPYSV
jgi:hypothetical protein